ncbi:MAG: DUF1772 domain-containing protein [Chitinophagales bacterium]|nr:DUF1772 domain-containing protein [Chitinophagales bacterium]
MARLIRFLNIIMAGLVSGVIFGIWLGYNPAGLSAPTYIEQQQSVIRALNVLMPILGLITIVLTLLSALGAKKDKGRYYMLLLATALLIVSGLTTKFGNQPINSIVMTWDMHAAPDNWMALRDKWWSFHIIRTTTAVIAFALIVWTSMRKEA